MRALLAVLVMAGAPALAHPPQKMAVVPAFTVTPAHQPQCASTDERDKIAIFMASDMKPGLFMAGAMLKVTEAKILSVLGPERAHSVSPSHFPKIWDSLTAWKHATTLIIKGEQIFEIEGAIPKGLPSAKGKGFNLDQHARGLGGHLRPDQLSSIHAVDMKGREGHLQGVFFMDAEGKPAFAVLVPEGTGPRVDQARKDFAKTRALISDLPAACTQ